MIKCHGVLGLFYVQVEVFCDGTRVVLGWLNVGSSD